MQLQQVGISFSDGLEIDRNTSRRLLQRLRQALRWEEAPVITGFDPRFNQSQPMWCAVPGPSASEHSCPCLSRCNVSKHFNHGVEIDWVHIAIHMQSTNV